MRVKTVTNELLNVDSPSVYVQGIGGYTANNDEQTTKDLQTVISELSAGDLTSEIIGDTEDPSNSWYTKAEMDVFLANNNLTEVTWAELSNLRSTNSLVKGRWYRITDYDCTTVQQNTTAAGHRFDIIVRADSTSKLNENAYATNHDGFTYFENCNLESWRLKYSLDNDSGRFAWAQNLLSPSSHERMILVETSNHSSTYIYVRYPSLDSSSDGCAWVYDYGGDGVSFADYIDADNEDLDTGDVIYTDDEYPTTGITVTGNTYIISELSWGRGVVYYMKDEWNNECPYDFKNIQFKRKLSNGVLDTTSGTDTCVYTFNAYDTDNTEQCDATIICRKYTVAGETDMCCDNIIKEHYIANSDSSNNYLTISLNNIVFLNTFEHSDEVVLYCLYNTFGNDCYNITFGNNCYSNTFRNYCQSNTFRNNCFNNTFGNSCGGNTFGNSCGGNTFGNGCYGNTFGNNCYSNTFGNNCYSNTFGNDCYSNTFGGNLQSKTVNYSNRVVETIGASHAEGSETTASGNYSHAEGNSTTASNQYSHAEGNSTTASGQKSHAEGNITNASGEASHAEGTGTNATGDYSHAECNSCQASGLASHAEGMGTISSGQYSHTEGRNTQTTNTAEHAEGQFNKSNTKTNGTTDENKAGTTQSSIGIGTTFDDRKNAVEVMQNGDVYITGVGNYNGTNPNTTGVQTLQGVISDLESLPSPMVFKGTATITLSGTIYTITVSSPASISDIKEGYTYKIVSVPTDDTNFKVGDTIIANQDAPGNNPQTNWSLIPSGDDVEDTWRAVNVNGTQLLGNGISTGALNLKSGNNISVAGSGNDVTIDIPQTATPSVTSVEASYTDTDHNLSGYRGMLAKKKVYTGVLGVANGSSAPDNNTRANRTVYFLTVHPRSFDSQWTIHYHLNIHLDDENQLFKSSQSAGTINLGQLCRGTYDCTLVGNANIYKVFHYFQSVKSTSYYPIYYHMFHGPTQAGFDEGYKIGVDFYSSSLPVPTNDWSTGSSVLTSYPRTIEVTVDECVNCTAEFNETLEIEADAYRDDYVKLNQTYYTTNTTDSNSAGRWTALGATAQGLYESLDSDTLTYTQQTNNCLKNGTHYDDDTVGNTGGYFLGYNLLGFDKDGKALAISKSTPTTTAYTATVYTNRVYCDVGFDYTKGIRYYSGSGNYGEGVDMNISTQINYSGLDLRYSDNCVASSGAQNSLGMVSREPVYLRGTIGDGGLFYLAPIEVTYNNATYKRTWVQPGDANRLTTNPFDTSHVYWFIGYPTNNSSYPNSLYQLNLITQGELSYYDGTQLKPYTNDKPVLANGTTVNTIKVTVGGQTSADYTVPYATQAGSLTSLTNMYSANIAVTSSAVYNTQPEFKEVKINGSTTNAASTENCVMQYDTTNKCVKFVFN